MEEILSPIHDETHAVHDVQAASADDSDTFVVFALIICFTFILFVAFRYASIQYVSDFRTL